MKKIFNYGIILLYSLLLINCELLEEKLTEAKINASDYIITTPSHGVKYSLSDENENSSCDIWVVNQDTSLTNDLFIKSIEKSGDSNFYFRNSVISGKEHNDGSNDFLLSGSGFPVGNQANYIQMFHVLKKSAVDGDSWNIPWVGSYLVKKEGSVTVNETTFEKCIRVELVADQTSSNYLNGSGYAIFAPEIGIIKLEFTRTVSTENYSDTKVVMNYINSTQFNPYTVAGKISSSSYPTEGLYIQYSNKIIDPSAITNPQGEFSLGNLYGTDITLRIGYNGNDEYDETLDFDYPVKDFPKEFKLSGTEDISNLIINLDEL